MDAVVSGDDLLPAERQVAEGVASAEDVRVSEPPAAAENREEFDTWDWEGREVRASFLRALLLGQVADLPEVPHRVAVHGARISGPLDVERRHLGTYLQLTHCELTGPLQLGDASLPGLMLTGSRLVGIDLERADVELVLGRNLVLEGQAMLSAAQIGHLDLGDSSLENPGEWAIDANVLVTKRSLRLRNARVKGSARFIGASIGGQLVLRGARFSFPVEGKPGLSLHETTTARTLYLREAEIAGRANVSGARIGGRIDAYGARFSTLSLRSTSVGRAVQLREATFEGPVDMRSIHVGTHVTFENARWEPSEEARDQAAYVRDTRAAKRLSGSPERRPLLDLSAGEIRHTLSLTPARMPAGLVNLARARVGLLEDTAEAWQAVEADLRGFDYRTILIDEGDWTLGKRIRWLNRQAEHSAQPYDRLAAQLRDQGRVAEARRVAFERERASRKQMPWWRRGPRWLFAATVGSGYQLHRILWWLLALWLLGTVGWLQAWDQGVMATVEGATQQCPANTACFRPAVMSADVLLPFIELRQSADWRVSGQQSGAAVFEWLYIVQTVLGWAIATVVVAGFGRLLTRD